MTRPAIEHGLVLVQLLVVITVAVVPQATYVVGPLALCVAAVAILWAPWTFSIVVLSTPLLFPADWIGEDFIIPLLGFNWYAMDWFLLFGLTGVGIRAVLERRQPERRSTLHLPMFGFLVAMTASAAIGLHNGFGLQRVLADARLFGYYVTFFLVFATLVEGRHLRVVAVVLLMSGIIGAIPQIVDALTRTQIEKLTGSQLAFGRIVGTHEANYPVIVCFGVAMYATARQRWERLLAVMGVLVGGTALLLSYTRGSWLAATVGIVWITMLQLARERSLAQMLKRLGLATATGFLLFVALDLANILPIETLLRRLAATSTTTIDISTLQRLTEWGLALQTFLSSPFLGAGLGFVYEFWAIGFGERTQTFIHNSYFYVLSKAGLVGLSALLWILAAALRSGVNVWLGGRGDIKRFGMMWSSVVVVYAVKALTTWDLNALTTAQFVAASIGILAVAETEEGRSTLEPST